MHCGLVSVVMQGSEMYMAQVQACYLGACQLALYPTMFVAVLPIHVHAADPVCLLKASDAVC